MGARGLRRQAARRRVDAMRRARRVALAGGAAAGLALAVTTTAEAADFTVSNALDAGPGSLRQAILDSNGVAGRDRVVFGAGATGTITLTSGQLTITDALDVIGPGSGTLTISGNDASRIFDITKNASITGLHLTHGASPAGTDGGAIRANTNSNRLDLTDIVADSNVSSRIGGGVSAQGSYVTITNSTIADNRAQSGGGVATNGGVVRLQSSTVSGNQALDAGGGLIGVLGSIAIVNSTISGNTSNVMGGGSIGYGGGLLTYYGLQLSIESSTIAGNAAPGKGGGGVASVLEASNPVLHNTIVAGNTAANDPDLSSVGTTRPTAFDASFSLIGTVRDGTVNTIVPGSNVIGVDPQLAALAANGGLTRTQAISGGSLAVDAGDPDDFPATDQRGLTRPQATAPDIGAFEMEDTQAPATVLDERPKRKVKTTDKKTTVGLSFSSNEPGSTFECALDGAKPADAQLLPCTSPQSYVVKSKSRKGRKYTFRVVATDSNGNVDPTPAKAKFKVIRNLKKAG
jgi:hypothetical protein